MITDTISDMFTRIRNANSKMHEKVDIPCSKLKIEIARILKNEGYISNYKSMDDKDKKQGVLRVYLKYTTNGKAVIQGIKRVSKPSLRVYKKYSDISKIMGGLGIAIISTSKGLLIDKDARREKIGGEIIGYVW